MMMDAIQNRLFGGGLGVFAGVTFLIHHYLQFPSGWVKLETKYDRCIDEDIWRDSLSLLSSTWIRTNHNLSFGSFLMIITDCVDAFNMGWLCPTRNGANVVDDDDDNVIVLTRYGLIVDGTKWPHKYKYFGEAIDGWWVIEKFSRVWFFSWLLQQNLIHGNHSQLNIKSDIGHWTVFAILASDSHIRIPMIKNDTN